MKQRNLFATLIGINAYPRNPLRGCVRDALGMDAFLREYCRQQDENPDGALEYRPLYLLAPDKNDEALIRKHTSAGNITRFKHLEPSFANVSSLAFEHLKQAQKGDICLFYYSGHGSTIEAPPELQGSKSKPQNETIVCVDSRDPNKPRARDLIDKEIAYLLWEVLKDKEVHCVIIMDCCFAGNNTRGEDESQSIRFRHETGSKNKIPFDKYLGSGTDFYTVKEGRQEIKIAKYVQLAASLDNEKSQETDSEGGLFTSKLLNVLRSGGSSRSYRDLMQVLRVSVRNVNERQNPVAFALEDGDLDQPFFGGRLIPYKASFEVRFDAESGNWKLYGGAVDGLTPTSEHAVTSVKINNSEKEIQVKEVHNTFSVLDAAAMSGLDKSKEDYRAVLTRLAGPALKICLSDAILKSKTHTAALKNAYTQKGMTFPYIDLSFEKKNKTAPFQIRVSDEGEFVLTRTGNHVPLFKREKDPASFLTNADYVGKWMSTLELKNSSPRFAKEKFVFTLEKIEGQALTNENLDTVPSTTINHLPDEAVFSYRASPQNKPLQPAFRLSIGIHQDSDIESCYVGALYLGSTYGIRSDFIKSDAHHLVKGGDPVRFTLGDKHTVPLKLDPKYALYDINEVACFLKIFVSGDPGLDLKRFNQTELLLDDQPNRKTRDDIGLDRDTDNTGDETDWSVFTTKLRIIGLNKEKTLESGASTDFSGFSVAVPEGFSATAFAASADDVTRKLSKTGSKSMDADTERMSALITPPAGIFGNAIIAERPFATGMNVASDNSMIVLELKPLKEGAPLRILKGETIRIRPKQSAATKSLENEVLETTVPFGFDEVSGLYFPAGYTDEAGDIHIDKLPEPTEGLIQGDEKLNRSLGGSVKLFFMKVVWSRLTGEKEYDKLTMSRRKADGSLESTIYYGTAKSKNQAAAIAKEVAKGGKILLLVHGIIGDTAGMVNAAFYHTDLHERFPTILAFDYENLNTNIEDTAQKLKSMLADCGITAQKNVTIIAHSMGGLVSRHLIEHLEGDQFVHQLLQCGTPNTGSEIADFRQKTTGWLAAGMNGVAFFQPYMAAASFFGNRLAKGLFRTLDQMEPESAFLNALNAAGKKKPEAVQYYLVGGDTSLIEAIFPEQASLIRKTLSSLKQRGLYLALDNAIFESIPNDMAVKVDRMKKLPWGEHMKVHIIPCDHVTYFDNPESLSLIQTLV